jgi:hypothetical protein
MPLSSRATTFEAFPAELLTEELVRARTFFVALSPEQQEKAIHLLTRYFKMQDSGRRAVDAIVESLPLERRGTPRQPTAALVAPAVKFVQNAVAFALLLG